MIQLSISVGAANLFLWLLVEVFLILLSHTATRLVARFSVNRRLLSNSNISLNGPKDLIDKIPYNGDIFLARPPLKLVLTLYRICIVGISLYIGLNLDGDRELSRNPFPASSETFLSTTAGDLTSNSGDDLNAMAKLSCLQVVDNNLVLLYKGYVSPSEHILCQDGNSTESENILLKAEIRATFRTPKTGLNISDTAMSTSAYDAQLTFIDLDYNRLVVNATDEEGLPINVAARIVLMKRLGEGKCQFGMWRSKGLGFSARVDIKVEASCNLRIAAVDRLLRPKPEFLPPRMSFLFQIVDSILLSKAAEEAPHLRKETIVATFPLRATILLAVGIAVSAGIYIVFSLIIRRGRIKNDLFSARGVGDVLGGPSGTQALFRWAKDSDRVILESCEVGNAMTKRKSIQAV